MITVYVQGSAADQDIFGPLGRMLTDDKIHKQLGMAITSTDGDLWFVDINREGIVQGFSQVRHHKTKKSSHIRFLYAPLVAVQNKLVKTILKYLTAEKRQSVYINDRASETLWIKNGFTTSAVNGNKFIRWEKQLEEKK